MTSRIFDRRRACVLAGSAVLTLTGTAAFGPAVSATTSPPGDTSADTSGSGYEETTTGSSPDTAATGTAGSAPTSDSTAASGGAAGGTVSGTVVASALTNPRGMTWDDAGTLVVTLAGSGGTNPATETVPASDIIGPFMGGTTSAVAFIDTNGCPSALATGLPSTIDGMGSVLGVDDVAYVDGEYYISVDGGGAAHGNPDDPSGIYRLNDEGAPELIADLSAWNRDNPVATLPGDSDPDAIGYSMVADPETGALWVGDANSGQILSVQLDGTIARVADLSADHPVPTRLAADPEGGVYVGTLTAVPFTDGAAKVIHVAADGTVTDVWTGLTAVADVAVGDDGTLYALELGTGNTEEPPFLNPTGGQIVRQTGPDGADVVAGGLSLPISMEIGPDGAFYVAAPAFGADDGSGTIVRIAEDDAGAATATTTGGSDAATATTTGGTDAATATTTGGTDAATATTTGGSDAATATTTGGSDAATATAGECTPLAETLSAAAPTAGSTPTGSTAPAGSTPAGSTPTGSSAPAGSTPTGSSAPTGSTAPAGSAPAGATTVTIENFEFVAPTLEVPAGTTVTFVNNDSAEHTATADDGSFDTDDLEQGASAEVTFDTPGTYSYHCEYHPFMVATITVT